MLYTDASITTVDGAFTVLDDPISVIDGSEWPASDFTVKVWSAADPKVLKAVIYVGTRTANSLSGLTWDYGGHTDVNLADGDYIALSSTRFDYQTKEYVHYLAGRMEDETPHALDDFFTANTLADYTQTTPSGTATPQVGRGALSWVYEDQNSGDAVPFTKAFGAISPPITIETRVRLYGPNANNIVGLCFANGTVDASSIIIAGPAARASGTGVPLILCYSGTVANIVTAHNESSMNNAQFMDGLYLRLLWKAANTWRVAFSIDGITWSPTTGDLTFAMTPTRLGVFVSSYGTTTPCVASFDYLRVYEADLVT